MTQLIFAQFTLVLALCFVIVGKLSRWRPLWLMAPAVAGLTWLLAVDVRPAVVGYLAWAGQLLRLLAGHDPLSDKIADLRGLLDGWMLWLPRQAPVALIVAAAEAAIVTLPGRGAGPGQYRRGVLVLARCSYLAATLRRGELATRDGCGLGVVAPTGRPATISWLEAESGVLSTGQDAGLVCATGRDLAIAAIQHRKTVVIVDLIGDTAGAGISDLIESECAAVGAPLRRFGGLSARYDPFSGAPPARATSLTMAMVDWAGVAQARQLFCANYLNAAFTVLGAGRDGLIGQSGLLEEVVRLMAPGALRGQLSQLRGQPQADRRLATRVAELSGQLDTDPAILAPVAGQLAELSAATPAQRRPASADDPLISLGAALAAREVVFFPIGRRSGRPIGDRPIGDRLGAGGPMIARLVVADLIEILAERGDLGSRVDCLVWINGCEAIDRRQLAVLVALGERTGAAVVLGTAIGPVAAGLAADVNVVAVRGASPGTLVARLAGETGPDPAGPSPLPEGLAAILAESHAPGHPDALSFGVHRPSPRLVACCKAVR